MADGYCGDDDTDTGSLVADDLLTDDEPVPDDLMADIEQGSVRSVRSVGGEEDQLTELKEMMQDLQSGFTAALSELSKIQDEDQELHEKLETSKRQQDAQISDILDIVKSLKAQCDDIQHQIQLSNKNQRKLEKQIRKLKAERHGTPRGGRPPAVALDSLSSAHSHTEDTTYSPMMRSFIASLPLPEEMENVEDHHSDSDHSLAAVTQKSLSLSNSLAQKVLSKQSTTTSHTVVQDAGSDRSSQQSSHTGIPHTAELDNRSKPDQLPANQNKMQRYTIVQSLLESERAYCTTLYSILENSNYNGPSLNLTSKELSRVFPPSLTQIYHHHCTMLRHLEHRLTRWKQQDIVGDLLAKFTATKGHLDIFSYYKDYVNNLSVALRTVRNHNSPSSSSSDRCPKLLNTEYTGTDWISLVNDLLAPVRRIPSYVLHIKQLHKYTEPDHPDRYFLDMSLDMFRLAVETMNEIMQRTVQMASPEKPRTNRSIETSSWSSHEEDQRLSTATKDSGIHSNCDLDSHDELSPPPYKAREDSFLSRKKSSSIKRMYTDRNTSSLDTSIEKVELPQRPRSVVDFIAPENYTTLPLRSQTPSLSVTGYSNDPSNPNGHIESKLRLGHTSISHSTPDLLDDYSQTQISPTKQKAKHKVQFKNPPEEPVCRTGSSRLKKRSITDTLRIFFNKKRGQKTASTSDLSDSCSEFTTSTDDTPKPAPPDMFANECGNQYGSQRDMRLTETYEDENGDPYSVV